MSVHLSTEAYEKPVDPAGERSSIAFVQLEKHNERLKDALVRCVSCVPSINLAFKISSLTELFPF